MADDYEHDDGTTVSVSLNERGQGDGGKLAVYHRSEDGTRMGYHRFRVPDLNEPVAQYQPTDEHERPPDAVIAGVHAAGWEIGNLSRTDLPTDETAPIEIRLLDVRDLLEDMASGNDSLFLRLFLRGLANGAEQCSMIVYGQRTTAGAGADLDAELLKALRDNKRIDQSIMSNPEVSLREFVQSTFGGLLDNNQASLATSGELIEKVEEARRQYRLDETFAEMPKKDGFE